MGMNRDTEVYHFKRIVNDGISANILNAYRYSKESFCILEFEKESLEEIDKLQTELQSDFLLTFWKESKEVKLVFYSRKKTVRAFEFLEFLISEFGLVKGDALSAYGEIFSAILEVQVAELEMEGVLEYFMQKSNWYFEECECVQAAEYAQKKKEQIQKMQRFFKKKIAWAYVRTEDIAERGKKLCVKSLENESGSTIQATEDRYIMIGCRGEIYDISREKFENTYEATEESLDIFTSMLDFIPVIETIPETESILLDEVAKICYPKQNQGIFAVELAKRTKVFPVSGNQEYFLGREGDYMAIRVDDLSDIYIIQREVFVRTYEEAGDKEEKE